MTPQEQELIKGLFDRLSQLESQPRDPEAERLIGVIGGSLLLDGIRSMFGDHLG